MAKFVIKTRKSGEFQFDLKASNGQGILTSEGYSAKAPCLNGIESVRKNSQQKARFQSGISLNGKHYFNLKASNGQIIGTSELYESASGKENGIESVIKNAPKAELVDET